MRPSRRIAGLRSSPGSARNSSDGVGPFNTRGFAGDSVERGRGRGIGSDHRGSPHPIRFSAPRSPIRFSGTGQHRSNLAEATERGPKPSFRPMPLYDGYT